MKFSVVIPALNEEKFVSRAVASIAVQNVGRENFEIIVVDNNSTDATSVVARSAGADKVVLEAKTGTNLARQRGVLESSGEIVAFLDADCEAPADWLQKISVALLGDVVAISGPYSYGYGGVQKLLEHFYTRIVLRYISAILFFIFRRKAGVITGGNFAAKRSAIDAIGGLPPLTFWGDDTAVAILLSRRVGRVIYDPKFVVKSSPRRLKKRGFIILPALYAHAFFKIYFSKEYGW